ncbi:MAG: hypothetical protein Ct9H300mP10_10410 [Methanobacteriota archaeon]|nr:MAG: hypothetical protein Ct9H300mP10_10410 [Euryarchaeota archaeon]
MTRVQTTASIALVLLLTASLVSPSEGWREEYLEDDPLRMEQFGGGGSLEDQCGSITFEDMFEYTKAEFVFDISPDWQTADVRAVAWINATLAETSG